MLTPAAGSPDPAAQAVIQGAIYQGALGMFLISWAFLCAIYCFASTRMCV